MSEGGIERFEQEVQQVRQELAGWLGANPPAQSPDAAVEGFPERFGPPDAREGIIARGQLAALVEAEERPLANAAAHLLELLAERAGQSPVALWDRYEEGLERLRDGAAVASSEPGATDERPAREAMAARRAARTASRRARAIRADLTAAGRRALLLLAGGWLIGIRATVGMGWVRALLVVLAVAVASALLHGMLLPRQARMPQSARDRFALVQPWLLTVALQGALLYWLCGSPRLSFWATVLGLAFTMLTWPTRRALEAWRALDLADMDD
jgi:hypothetical protein